MSPKRDCGLKRVELLSPLQLPAPSFRDTFYLKLVHAAVRVYERMYRGYVPGIIWLQVILVRDGIPRLVRTVRSLVRTGTAAVHVLFC